MSRVINCLAQRAAFVLRPCPALTHTAANSSIFGRQSDCCATTSRSLYTANGLGIPKLDKIREQSEQKFVGEARERYVERARASLEENDRQSLYRDDLINMLGIAESDEDLDLLEKLLEHFSSEDSVFSSGWGTTVMRLYYKMNQLERALKAVEDDHRFGEFFRKPSCYKIAMTMLYDQGKYEKMIELYNLHEHRLDSSGIAKSFLERTGKKLSPERDLVRLMLAGLARLNTPAALDTAKSIVSCFVESGRQLSPRDISFVAYLAMLQGDYKYALNQISTLSIPNYVSLRDTKMRSLLRLERYDDAVLELRQYANFKTTQRPLLSDTFEDFLANKDKIQDVALRQCLEGLLNDIKSGNHVSDVKIVDMLFQPIDYERAPFMQQRNSESSEGGFRTRGFRDDGGDREDRRPFRRNRFNDGDNDDKYEDDDGDDDNNRTRRFRGSGPGRGREFGGNSFRAPQEGRGGYGGGRGGFQRNDRKISFQNVNFD